MNILELFEAWLIAHNIDAWLSNNKIMIYSVPRKPLLAVRRKYIADVTAAKGGDMIMLHFMRGRNRFLTAWQYDLCNPNFNLELTFKDIVERIFS